MVTAAVQRRHVHTTLNFFKPSADGLPPGPAYMSRPETFERPQDSHEVLVHDVSGEEATYTLDRHGFQFVTLPSEEREFLDPDRIRDVYYKEVEQLVKDMTGASRVYIFDHTIRRPAQKPPNGVVVHDAQWPSPSAIPPTFSVHVDQSYDSALSRVAFHLPKDAERLLEGRVQLLNIWRPIKTIRRDPLAVSPSSCFEEDLVPIPVVYPHGNRTGATLSVRYDKRQLWFYKSQQTPDEALVFKCFDNRSGVYSTGKYAERAKRVPHSAFKIPGTEGEEERESIEVRCLAFHEHDDNENE